MESFLSQDQQCDALHLQLQHLFPPLRFEKDPGEDDRFRRIASRIAFHQACSKNKFLSLCKNLGWAFLKPLQCQTERRIRRRFEPSVSEPICSSWRERFEAQQTVKSL